MSRRSLDTYRVEQCPTRQPYDAGRGMTAVPLWVLKNEEHLADVILTLPTSVEDDIPALVAHLLNRNGERERIAAHAVAHPADPYRARGER